MFEIVISICVAVIIFLIGFEIKRTEGAINKIVHLAMKVSELEDQIDSVDKSTGADIHRLATEFQEFKTDFGEAAIEEMRETARKEKAWAQGINAIMSYGAPYQDGGNGG